MTNKKRDIKTYIDLALKSSMAKAIVLSLSSALTGAGIHLENTSSLSVGIGGILLTILKSFIDLIEKKETEEKTNKENHHKKQHKRSSKNDHKNHPKNTHKKTK